MFDYLLDKHVDQTHKAFHQLPLNRNLRCFWFLICCFVFYLWSSTYFNPDIRAKVCITEQQLDGTWTLVNQQDASKNAVNVSNNFKRLSFMMLSQATMMMICCVYQLTAIFLFKQMFRYRMIVSRINKLNLLFGGFLLALAYYYRLSGAGKFCSGAHLTDSELMDPKIANTFLIEEGRMFIYRLRCRRCHA